MEITIIYIWCLLGFLCNLLYAKADTGSLDFWDMMHSITLCFVGVPMVFIWLIRDSRK